jgi:4-amino-4-deoxy-L-arabinose transferase-like glycosyltransferase
MAIILLIIFVLGTLNFYFQKKKSLSLAFIYTTFLVAIATVVITEISSFFNAYNFNSSTIFWSILAGISIYINFKEKQLNNKPYLNWFKENKKVSLFFGGTTILLLIQGIIYPPNNWDSMTYHMARIAHWVMNESIEPYPTHIYRQIYQPPLAEWIIAQVCILNKADYFANAVQLFFLLGTLGVLNQIMLHFNTSKKTRIWASIIAFTTPSVFMQATSTQNDIVVAFFLLSSILFFIQYFKESTLKNTLLIGLAIGCAILTKGTAFVYLIPIILFCGAYLIYLIFKKEKSIISISFQMIVVFIFTLTIGFNHYYRNFKLSGDIFGASDDHYFNKNITLKSTGLGILKNIGNHFSTPITSSITNQVIEKAHLITQIPINDDNYNYKGIHFKLNKWNHNEDEVSNIFQVLLILGVCLFIVFNWKNRNRFLLPSTFFCLFTFGLFSLILKWQPWHMRLQVPLFILFAIPISIVLEKIKSTKITNSIIVTSIIYCLILAFLNPNRPLIKNTKQAKLNTRFERYFVAMPPYLKEYKMWRSKLKSKTQQKWDVHGDTWEYPIYYDCFSVKRKGFQTINIKNQTKKLVKKVLL